MVSLYTSTERIKDNAVGLTVSSHDDLMSVRGCEIGI